MSRAVSLAFLLLVACNGKKTPAVDAEPPTDEAPAMVDADTEGTEAPVAVEEVGVPLDASLAIADTRWELTWSDGKEAATGEGVRTVYFKAVSGATATLDGQAGCNRFFGTAFTATETAVSFGMMGSTRMACPNLGDEHAFMRLLSEVDGWSVAGDVLTLSEGDTERARFVRAVDPDAAE